MRGGKWRQAVAAIDRGIEAMSDRVATMSGTLSTRSRRVKLGYCVIWQTWENAEEGFGDLGI
jgi:hypothetical protein